MLFGIGSGDGWQWSKGNPGAYIGLGLIGFGWGCAGDLSMAYLMDAYPDTILEGMVGVAVINNTLAMIFTFTCSKFRQYEGNVKPCKLMHLTRPLVGSRRRGPDLHRDWSDRLLHSGLDNPHANLGQVVPPAHP